MSYNKVSYYPEVVPLSKKGYWNLFEICRITGLKKTSVKRYITQMKITADNHFPISNRNRHKAAHYKTDTFLKIMNWFAHNRRETK